MKLQELHEAGVVPAEKRVSHRKPILPETDFSDVRVDDAIAALKKAGIKGVRAKELKQSVNPKVVHVSFFMSGTPDVDDLHAILDPIFPDGFMISSWSGGTHVKVITVRKMERDKP